ncbi:sensor histidine kinase [Echinicola shivajiensis]|uniref:sensor histidine kinase n=1 Tax=Echinicola shivajiensis TaxID=1035916 RepID=UPI001BFCA618|nr:histidine kinase [Echinicola shivajiensis]
MQINQQKNLLKTTIHILILGIILSPAYSFFVGEHDAHFSLFYFSITNISIILFYLVNIIWLIPNFLLKRKYLQYSLIFILLTALFFIIHEYFRDIPPSFEAGTFVRGVKKPSHFMLLSPSLFRLLMILGLGTSIELILQFEQEKKKYEELEKQRMIKELNFLKNQLNPHFLFNALNNIYSLARKKSEDTTPAILLLSDMLRYVLYESGKDKVTLGQEVTFIKNYVNLEKLKFSSENAPKISHSFQLINEDYPIEPLLFVTLIENAFKHGISYLSPSFVMISIAENEKEILLSVLNSVSRQKDGLYINNNPEGVGINNLRKRMELLYPNRHSFKQLYENSTFKSFLTIKK